MYYKDSQPSRFARVLRRYSPSRQSDPVSSRFVGFGEKRPPSLITRLITRILVISAFILSSLILFVRPASAIAPEAPKLPPEAALDVPVLIQRAAAKYGADGDMMAKTLWCESGYNPDAVGDGGTSFGVAQIHLPSHQTITQEQALNPEWAIDWTAREFAAGRARQWTCFRLLAR